MSGHYSFKTEEEIAIKVIPPEVELSIIRRLGKPRFYISENNFFELMGKIYNTASKKAMETLRKPGKE